MISVTITDRSGRTLSGQTIDAFWTSIAHARPLSVGINCALGAREMRPYLAELAAIAPTWVSCYPNAGPPERLRRLRRDPGADGARCCASSRRAGSLNLVGGCCGTTDAHIRAIAEAVAGVAPRVPPAPPRGITRFSGLETYTIRARLELHDDRRAHQRDRLAPLRGPDQARATSARRTEVALDQVRARRQHPRRQHGRGHARLRAGHDDLPQPDRHRARDRAAPDHGRQLEVVGDRGRPQVRPGQGHRELDQPEGRRGRLPRARPAWCSATAPASS